MLSHDHFEGRAPATRGGELEISYVLSQLTPGMPLHFGVEFNFAAMAAGAGGSCSSHGAKGATAKAAHDCDACDDLAMCGPDGLLNEGLGRHGSPDKFTGDPSGSA